MSPDDLDRLDRLARKRAAAKMGFLIHLTAYLLVNLLLATISIADGRHWAIFPALGWGIGLAVHGAVVFLASSGHFDAMVRRERARLSPSRDPW